MHRTLAFLYVMTLCLGCGRGSDDAAAHMAVQSDVNSTPQPLSADGKAGLNAYLDAAQLPDLQYPNFENYRREAKEFYEASGDRLPWLAHNRPSRQAWEVIKALQAADSEGLNPIDYDGPRWAGRLGKMDPGRAPESEFVRFDLALTISTMRYVSDLHRGRVNPREFHFDLDIDNQKLDLSEFLRGKLLTAENVAAALATAEPPFPAYRRTVDALRAYTKLASDAENVPLRVPAKPLKPGDSYTDAVRLQNLLSLLGDLPKTTPADARGMAYKGPLVKAVKHFQQRHGLEPNGIAGPETFKELNTPLSQRVSQLQLTLERWRWLPHEFATPPIVVNIPEFRVYAVNEQYRPAFSMKVVVGRSYKHQTPVFASEVKAVIFRPYWSVPLDIQRKELLPELRKNPSYLQKHAYEVVDSGGAVVTDDGVSEAMMKQLYSGKLTIRQRPGNENSLGLLKFDMPNVYDVYMHGTPARQLFSRSRRDFSHGCIRVEDPVALAAWVLRDKPEWDSEHILAAMNGDTTFRVSLSKPVPVLILYGTATVTEGGEIHFYADIYGHDATLEQVLAKGYPYSIQ